MIHSLDVLWLKLRKLRLCGFCDYAINLAYEETTKNVAIYLSRILLRSVQHSAAAILG